MKNKNQWVGTVIKFLVSIGLFYFIALVVGISSIVRHVFVKPDLLTVIFYTALFITFFTGTIIWASTKKKKSILLIAPILYLVIEIYISYMFAPTPYALPLQ
jgi:hypothetical protein